MVGDRMKVFKIVFYIIMVLWYLYYIYLMIRLYLNNSKPYDYDNIIDIKQAADEIGSEVPIAGNVDPVSIVMKGTKEEIFADVKRCVEIGSKAKKGYTLATGCDIPETTDPQKIDWFMDAARACGEYKG